MLDQSDIVYFVMTDRFRNGDPSNDAGLNRDDPKAFHGGDFAGLVQSIPYFKTLGVTAVWITPVYLSVGTVGDASGYHGYWALDFDKVDPRLYSAVEGRAEGSKGYLRDLVQTFHDNGLKVILDMVVNHTGYHNDAYRLYPDKKIGYDWFNQGEGEIEGTLAGLPDLNLDDPKVADYFVNNILDWIEQTGIDAIRMDTVKHVEDAFWYYFKSYVKSRHPTVTLLGEVLISNNPADVGRYQREHDFDTLFDFPLREAISQTFIHNVPMTRIARPRLREDEPKGALDFDSKNYVNANRLVTLLDNHDLSCRYMTEIRRSIPAWDSNLARDIMKLSLSFLMTTRGIPQIYYGTELAMEGGGDHDNRRDMPWDAIGEDGRPHDGTLEREIFEHTLNLIQLRKRHDAVRFGSLLTLWVDQFVYVYLREFRGDLVLVAINNGLDAMSSPLTIDVAQNANVPPRVLSLLRDSVLECHTPGLVGMKLSGTAMRLKLPRKTAAIYSLPGAILPKEVEVAAVAGHI